MDIGDSCRVRRLFHCNVCRDVYIPDILNWLKMVRKKI